MNTQQTRLKISRTLAQDREAKGVTLAELSDKSKLSVRTCQNILKGQSGQLDSFVSIARVLGRKIRIE